MATEGKTVTIQHLSSDQANLGRTENDSELPSTSGGGGIGAWISSHKLMLAIIGGGAVLGLIVFFYIKNNQATQAAAATTTDGATTDTTTTSPDGTATGTTSGVDFSPIENLLNQEQTSLDAILNAEQSEQGTPQSGPTQGCPSGMHHAGGKSNGKCICNEPNMINKGDHCEKKTMTTKKGGGADYNIGGGYEVSSSPMFQDLNVGFGNPYRHNGHRMIYALGGSITERESDGGQLFTIYNRGGGFGRYAFGRSVNLGGNFGTIRHMPPTRIR